MLLLQGPREPVIGLAFAPDGTKLYAMHERVVGVHAWDLATRTVAPVEAEGLRLIREFVLHPGGRWAFGIRHRIYPPSAAIDLAAGRVLPLNFHDDWGTVAVSPDGQFATAHYVGSARREDWRSVLSGRTMAPDGPRAVWEVRLPSEEAARRVAFVGNDILVTEDVIPTRAREAPDSQTAHRFVVRSAADGKPITTLDSPYGVHGPRDMFGSPDGKRFVARLGLSLRVWDATDWQKPPVVVPGNENPRGYLMRAARFHPSGNYLLLANDSPSVLVFDTTTWKAVRRWNWKAGTMRAVAMSADGALAAASGPSGAVVVWDLDL